MGRKIISEEDICLLIDGKITTKQIQEKYNVSRQAVHNRVNFEYKRPEIYKKKFYVRFLFGIGFTIKQIMKETGYKYHTVSWILRRQYGVTSVKEVYGWATKRKPKCFKRTC
jgi:DNA invertase Pin-like site-specific DNA recombinase